MGEASRRTARVAALAMILGVPWCARGLASVPDLTDVHIAAFSPDAVTTNKTNEGVTGALRRSPWARLAEARGVVPDRLARTLLGSMVNQPGLRLGLTGSGPANGRVEVRLDGVRLGVALSDGNGLWRLAVRPALGAGWHRLSVFAPDPVSGQLLICDEARVWIPVNGSQAFAATFMEPSDPVARGARLGAAATRMFEDYIHKLSLPNGQSLGGKIGMPRSRPRPGQERREVAQSAHQLPPAGGSASDAAAREGAGSIAKAGRAWLRHAYGLYRRVIVHRLSGGAAQGGGQKTARGEGTQRKGAGRGAAATKAAQDGRGVAALLVSWLAWAHGVYQQDVVMRLTGKRQLGFAPSPAREAAVRQPNGVPGAAPSAVHQAETEKARAEAQRLQAQRDRQAAADARRRAEADARRIAEESRKVAERERQRVAAEAARKQAEERAKAAALADEARRAADIALAEVQRRAAREAQARKEAEAQAAAQRAAAKKKAQEAEAAAQAERARQEKLAAKKRDDEGRHAMAQARERAAHEAAQRARDEAERVARERESRAARTPAMRPKQTAEKRRQPEQEPTVSGEPSSTAADDAKVTRTDEARPKGAQASAAEAGSPRTDGAPSGEEDRKRVAVAGPSPSKVRPDAPSPPDASVEQAGRASTPKLPPSPERRKALAVAAADQRKAPSSGAQSRAVVSPLRTEVPLPVRGPSPSVASVRPKGSAAGAGPSAAAASKGEPAKRTPKVAGMVRRRCRYRTRRRIRPPGHYVVRHGDSLWLIALRHYARGRYYRLIYRANRRRIGKARLIYPCQRLYIPARRRHRRR